MAGCSVRGYMNTAIKIFTDKVNKENFELAFNEFKDFMIPNGNDTFNEEYLDDKNTTFIANGESGMVDKILHNSMVSNYDGTLIYYDKGKLKNIRLAYAITTHKSQGGQFKVVILVTPRSHTFMLNSNLLYVGISRAKEKCYHLGEIKTVNNALKKKENFDRKTLLGSFLQVS